MHIRAAPLVLLLAMHGGLVYAAEPQRSIALIPVSGKGSEACTVWLRDLLEESGMRVHLRKSGAPPPELEHWRDVATWVQEHRQQLQDAELVLFGVRYRRVLRLDLYRVANGAIEGLKTLKVAEDCAISERERQMLARWVSTRFAGAQTRGTDRAPAKTGPEDPLFVDADSSQQGPLSLLSSAASGAKEEPRLSAGAELRLVSRHLDFQGQKSSAIRGYSMDLVGVPRIFVAGKDLVSWLGAEVGLSRSILLDSRRADGGPTFPSALFEVTGELSYLIPLRGIAKAGAVRLGPVLGARHVSFRLFRSSDGSRPEGTPSVRYTSLLLGGEVEVPISERAAVDVCLAYQPLVGFGPMLGGELGAGSGSGLDLSAKVMIDVFDAWSVHFVASYQAYFMDLARTDLAAGATDEMPQVGLGIGYAF